MLPLAGQPSSCFASQEVRGEGLKLEVHSPCGERGGEGTLRQRVNVKPAGTAVFNSAWEETPVTSVSMVPRGEGMTTTVRGESNQETRSSRSDVCCSRLCRCRLKMFVGKALRMGKLGLMAQALAWEPGNSGSVAHLYIWQGVKSWQVLTRTSHELICLYPLLSTSVTSVIEVVMLPLCVFVWQRDRQIPRSQGVAATQMILTRGVRSYGVLLHQVLSSCNPLQMTL